MIKIFIFSFLLMFFSCKESAKNNSSSATEKAEQRINSPILFGELDYFAKRGESYKLVESDSIYLLESNSDTLLRMQNDSFNFKSSIGNCYWDDKNGFHYFLGRSSDCNFFFYLNNREEKYDEIVENRKIILFFKKLPVSVLWDHIDTYEPKEVYIDKIEYQYNEKKLLKIEYTLSNKYFEQITFDYKNGFYSALFNRFNDKQRIDWSWKYVYKFPASSGMSKE